jgi:hypothetical protein
VQLVDRPAAADVADRGPARLGGRLELWISPELLVRSISTLIRDGALEKRRADLGRSTPPSVAIPDEVIGLLRSFAIASPNLEKTGIPDGVPSSTSPASRPAWRASITPTTR